MKPRLRTITVALLVLLAPRGATAQTEQTVSLDSSRTFAVYVAGPRDAAEGVVLVHDFFGVSPFFLGAVNRLAKRGYRVVGVDLYDGRRATTHAEAGALLGGLDAALATRKIDAAVATLTGHQRKLAVIGFSMGGRKALEAALRNRAIVATVEWYGETINDPMQLKRLAGPALLVVGSKDGASAAGNAAAFSKAADDAGAAAEIYVYPGAAHAFAQPLFNRGTTYDPVATDVAWQLTESFLRRTFTGDSSTHRARTSLLPKR
jgi:carboxymethylenebutenolidase